jgi:hypothetical protein
MTTDRAPKEAKDQKNRRQEGHDSEDAFQIEASAPLHPDHARILHLQRTIGNQAVQRLVSEGRLSVRPQIPRQTSPRIQRWDSPEHVEIGDSAGGVNPGRIVLNSHKRELPQHKQPVTTWPPEWQELYNNGNDQQKQALRDGLSYGEIVALSGDFYSSFAELTNAPLRQIYDLIPLMHSGGNEMDYVAARGIEYLTLAEDNENHFSNTNPGVGHHNIDQWRDMHIQAIQAARHGDANLAWGINAAADHFLTDAFSGGHLRTPRSELSGVVGGLVSKSLHDHDNEHGVQVTNAEGNTWTAYGDDMLHDPRNARNLELTQEALRRSKQDISDALAQRGDYPVPGANTVFSAESLVPHPVDPSQTPDSFMSNNFTDDDQIRQWTADHKLDEIGQQPAQVKIRMITILLDGWTGDDDEAAILRICSSVTSGSEMAQIRQAIAPLLVEEISDIGMRTRIRVALNRL